MLNLLIFVCLVYVLVRVCLGFWGYILKQSSLCSPVSLCWFPQSATPVSTPNTCIATWSFLGGCQVSHLPLSFFSVVLPMLPVLLVLRWRPHFQLVGTPNAWRKDLCKLVPCHLVSSCVIVQSCYYVDFFLVMVCDGVDFEHLCLPFFFSGNIGAQNPTTAKGCWGCGRNGLGEKSVPLIFVVGSAALS